MELFTNQVLAGIAPKLRRYDSGRLGIVATNAEVDSSACVEDAHFRLLGRRLVLEWLSLAKISNRLGIEPEGIVQGTVEFWSMVDGYGFSYACFGLGSLGRSRRSRLRNARRRRAQCENQTGGASAAVPIVAYVFHVSLRPPRRAISVLECRQPL